MRPRCASRRVSRESGEVFVSSLHLHNLPPVQVSVGTEPLELSSLFFPFLPLPVYPRVAPLSTFFPPRVTGPKRTLSHSLASLTTARLTTCEPQTQKIASPTCCWCMKTLHASAPEVSYRQEGDCNGIPTICMARLYRWARTQVRFLSLDGFHLHLVGSPLFWVG